MTRTRYSGRVGPIRVSAQERSGRVEVEMLAGTEARLDREDVPFLRDVLREAFLRSDPQRKDSAP